MLAQGRESVAPDLVEQRVVGCAAYGGRSRPAVDQGHFAKDLALAQGDDRLWAGRGRRLGCDAVLREDDLDAAMMDQVQYPGPNMIPYPSIRLEVIRDGIEDYEYLAFLSQLVKRAQALPVAVRPESELLAGAEELCRVPMTISRSMAEYTRQPGDILDRRREIGDMIERLIQVITQ